MDRGRTSGGDRGIADSGSANASAERERDEIRKRAQRVSEKETDRIRNW
jgi:hypothetical protein